MLFIRILLLPLGFIYGLVMELRNRLYDWGVFKSRRFSVPLISVGNLTMGGGGKTPFTIFLARVLQKHYAKIAVVSRGYRRQSRGLQLVSDGQNILLGPQEAGDEPYLMARRLPGVLVAVSEKRSTAIDFLHEKQAVDLVILDDAFQHRAVQRDVDILLINAAQPFRFNFPVPAGTMREFKYNYRRADITLLTNVESARAALPPIKQPLYKSTVALSELRDIHFKSAGNLEKMKGQQVLAFAAIANPQSFMRALQQEGIHVRYFKTYADHHFYSEEDLRRLLRKSNALGCSKILCTEKDLVKIHSLFQSKKGFARQEGKFFAVAMTLVIEEEQKLINNIQTILTKRR